MKVALFLAEEHTEELSSVSNGTQDIARIIRSAMEELGAIDDYNRRAEKTRDSELKELMIHNRDEEVEHLAMLLNKLTKEMPIVKEKMKEYMFKEDAAED